MVKLLAFAATFNRALTPKGLFNIGAAVTINTKGFFAF
jgi:hypothetical protein